MKSILIVDDHKIFREGIKSLLETAQKFQPILMADGGYRAIEMALQYRPDYILLDVAMPDMNGIEAARKIISLLPGSRIIALSMHIERTLILEMLKAGAVSYLLKDDAFDDLLTAMNVIDSTGSFLPARVTELLIQEFRQGSDANELTTREIQVLRLLALGHPAQQVANELLISIKTVETHRRNLMRKKNLNNLADLTRYALRNKLIDSSD